MVVVLGTLLVQPFSCQIDNFLFSVLPAISNEQCGSCICIRSIHSIICEGIHISTLDTIPKFYRNYNTLVIRDTIDLKLTNDICSWKLKTIIIRNNKRFECSSLLFCNNINIDSDCEDISACTSASSEFSGESSQTFLPCIRVTLLLAACL